MTYVSLYNINIILNSKNTYAKAGLHTRRHKHTYIITIKSHLHYVAELIGFINPCERN